MQCWKLGKFAKDYKRTEQVIFHIHFYNSLQARFPMHAHSAFLYLPFTKKCPFNNLIMLSPLPGKWRGNEQAKGSISR